METDTGEGIGLDKMEKVVVALWKETKETREREKKENKKLRWNKEREDFKELLSFPNSRR